jgi:hypothetical protein
VRVAVQKLEGVEAIDVSLERASADIRLRPGNRVTLPQLRQIVKDNGFTARDATVTGVGTLVERGGKPALEVTGINTVWPLVPDPKQPGAYKEAVSRLASDGSAVEIVGVLITPTNANQPDQIMVRMLRPTK